MAKFTPEDVKRIAERLRQARGRGHTAHFLIGAGCSISAGIPSASDLVKRIHEDYAAHCLGLSDGSRQLYGACMALLTINERRDLIRPYLDSARINWGTIALAQMIADGFIGRVLTVNFDLVLERACALLGIQPAVYDFGVAPASDPAMIVTPSILHLHGQSYGLVLLNTEDETRKHRAKLLPVLIDTLRNAPLVVVGYSGSADGIFQTLIDEFHGREGLYWVGHNEEPDEHVLPLLEKEHSQFVGGADFDRFMIELAQLLSCWPPKLFADPLGHLIGELEPVIPYPVSGSDSEIDLLSDLRQRLESWRGEQNSIGRRQIDLSKLYMEREYHQIASYFHGKGQFKNLSVEEKQIGSLSFVNLGNELGLAAKNTSGRQRADLIKQAARHYQHALSINPNSDEAYRFWGILLRDEADRVTGDDAMQLFAEAGEKFQSALAINPKNLRTLFDWGRLLTMQARHSQEQDARKFFAQAEEKYEAALTLQPENDGARYNLGSVLLRRANLAVGEEAVDFLAKAEKHLLIALKQRPHQTYNLACLRSLQGDEDACREALLTAAKNGTLPSVEYLMSDFDLKSVRETTWFKELVEQQLNKKI
ncbi:MAG: SIR2 family protein [Rhodopseudomonas palustris]|uniref:SIR2 family protein n=1 Tax=Rhodopseudomonas palustris TaxID=1076 RepID=A0A933S0L6_RHOPL|nr:SIR2 family protein [Rhodopseudomonas palustris]